ncbi:MULTISPECIES: ARPP-2 domain-containing protein [unclassified Nocardiopsis]|uniref:ARPP-2 domain-containing protein n=1 Tax=Nocardiopsis TaxID=2013 RepID=UPI00387ABB08
MNDALDLAGVTTGTAQQWGAVRLVPLLRSEPVPGLRLHPVAAGDLRDNRALAREYEHAEMYCYVPHAYVLTWEGDAVPSASYGTRVLPPGRSSAPRRMHLDLRGHRVRAADRGRGRFLPMRLAVDGLLSLFSGGPEIAWAEWSRNLLRHGPPSPVSDARPGEEIRGLAEALRVFEIHPGQCGVAVYVADVLASVHLYPHPDDYRALHASMLLDLFGEALYLYGLLRPTVAPLYTPLRESRVRSLADLRREVARSREETRRGHDGLMLSSLTGALYRAGGGVDFGGYDRDPDGAGRRPRFRTGWLAPEPTRGQDLHVGEVVADADGRTAYLKTLRLSAAQTRQARLLAALRTARWRLGAAAEGLGLTEAALVARLDRAGLGHLLAPGLLEAHRAERRRASRR